MYPLLQIIKYFIIRGSYAQKVLPTSLSHHAIPILPFLPFFAHKWCCHGGSTFYGLPERLQLWQQHPPSINCCSEMSPCHHCHCRCIYHAMTNMDIKIFVIFLQLYTTIIINNSKPQRHMSNYSCGGNNYIRFSLAHNVMFVHGQQTQVANYISCKKAESVWVGSTRISYTSK